MTERTPPVVSVIGRKNSGKTTLTVALAAELRRRGRRVGSVKRGHHRMELDEPGRDSWRHFHEGGVEAVLLVSPDRLGWVERAPGADVDPEALIGRFFGGRDLDLVLVEGYKHGPFAKIEVFRSELHARPVHDPAEPGASRLLALVTGAASITAVVPVIPLEGVSGSHVSAVADLVERYIEDRPDAS
jgi:molybdopterin-guanine dinucleotide biosynthesis protein MobB